MPAAVAQPRRREWARISKLIQPIAASAGRKKGSKARPSMPHSPASAGVAPISSRNRTIEAIRRVRGTFAGSASNAMESVLLIQSRMLYIAIRRYVKVTLQDLSELLGMEDAVEDSV